MINGIESSGFHRTHTSRALKVLENEAVTVLSGIGGSGDEEDVCPETGESKSHRVQFSTRETTDSVTKDINLEQGSRIGH